MYIQKIRMKYYKKKKPKKQLFLSGLQRWDIFTIIHWFSQSTLFCYKILADIHFRYTNRIMVILLESGIGKPSLLHSLCIDALRKDMNPSPFTQLRVK